MSKRTLVSLCVAAIVPAVFSGVGCKKQEETTTTAPAGATTNITVNGGTVAVREEEGISRYSDEGPEIGTVITIRDVVIRTASDNGAPILSRLGRGTGVNKKARRGPFYLVDFPTPNGMKPGWVLQSDVSAQGPAVTTTTTVAIPPTTTTPPATTTAPPLKLPSLKVPKKQ